jgi:hypothetical protein
MNSESTAKVLCELEWDHKSQACGRIRRLSVGIHSQALSIDQYGTGGRGVFQQLEFVGGGDSFFLSTRRLQRSGILWI